MSFRFPNKDCNRHSGPCFSNPGPEYITSTTDRNLELQCFIFNSNFSQIIITWWKEGLMRELTLGSEINNPRYALPRLSYEDWTLIIRNATINDAGVYICQINLLILKEKFFKVDIKNINKPTKSSVSNYQYAKDEGMKLMQVVKIMEKSVAVLGQEFSLTCLSSFSKITTDSSVLWLHNGSTRNSNHNSDVQITIQWVTNNTLLSNLIIPKLTQKHAGFWSCVQYFNSNINFNNKASFTLIIPENASVLSLSDQHTVNSESKLTVNYIKQIIVFCNFILILDKYFYN